MLFQQIINDIYSHTENYDVNISFVIQ